MMFILLNIIYKMNKQEKINKLTWEYFIEQKVNEIGKFILILVGILFFGLTVPLVLGTIIGDGYSDLCSDYGETLEVKCGNFYVWFEGLIYILIILFIGGIFLSWISDNWEEAEIRAKKEIKSNSKKRKK